MATEKPAPGRLELLREFVNTHDVEDGVDKLETPARLADWLKGHGLDAGARLTAEDVRRAIAFRESLRALLLANNGHPLEPGAVDTLNASLNGARLMVRVDKAGDGVEATLAPADGGLDRVLAELMAIVFHSHADGTWPRLKACAMDTCQWGFYDHSRNHSATWCSMEVCGNRAKVRSYRSRHGAKR